MIPKRVSYKWKFTNRWYQIYYRNPTVLCVFFR